jgi:hypothetical protein
MWAIGRSPSKARRTPRWINSSGYFFGPAMAAERLLREDGILASRSPRKPARLRLMSLSRGAATGALSDDDRAGPPGAVRQIVAATARRPSSTSPAGPRSPRWTCPRRRTAQHDLRALHVAIRQRQRAGAPLKRGALPLTERDLDRRTPRPPRLNAEVMTPSPEPDGTSGRQHLGHGHVLTRICLRDLCGRGRQLAGNAGLAIEQHFVPPGPSFVK